MRLLIADHHHVVRLGLHRLLGGCDGLEVVAEFATAKEALAFLRRPASAIDVVILDLFLEDRSGMTLLPEMLRHNPGLAVLVFSSQPEQDVALRALHSGARGYLCKQATLDELVDAIRCVGAGRRFISPGLADYLACNVAGGTEPLPHQRLTPREYEIFAQIASGASVKEVARRLNRSANTVASTRGRILKSMNLRDTAEIAAYAKRHGLAN